jgi:enolase-phosphatase E1
MTPFAGRGILLDIEGTISPLSYVREVLFPYARQHLPIALRGLWNDEAMPRICDELAVLHQSKNFHEWTGGDGMPPERRFKQTVQALLKLMDQDAKVGPLKEIQGLIWRNGFRDGTLRSELYGEVPRVLQEWKERHLGLRVYSSGSIEAQKQFFAHVNNGTTEGLNLTSMFSGFYDTTSGPKKEPSSYQVIANDWNLPAEQILFLSDIPAELDAAAKVGMQTGLLVRPENPPVPDNIPHPKLATLDDVRLG